jgi:hypothetical protein
MLPSANQEKVCEHIANIAQGVYNKAIFFVRMNP